MNQRRALIQGLSAGLAATCLSGKSHAQAAYPAKPIRLVVPYNPGGSSDLTARFIADAAKALLGQAVVVENRPGAGGSTGINSVLTSAADGYTLVQVTASPLVVRPHVAGTPYQTLKDLTPLARYMVTHAPFAVKADSPFKTIQDVIAFAKANPGRLRWAVGAPQGGPHLATEAMLRANGARATLIPVNGGAEALLALMGGNLEAVVVDDYARPLRDGEIRLLAESGPVKVTGHPGVPTYKELGYPISPSIFYGIVGPAGLPPRVLEVWERTIRMIVDSAPFLEMCRRINATPGFTGSVPFAREIEDDYRAMGKVLADLGMARK